MKKLLYSECIFLMLAHNLAAIFMTQYTASPLSYNITHHSEVLQHILYSVTSPPRSKVSIEANFFHNCAKKIL